MPEDKLWPLQDVPMEMLPVRRWKRYQLAQSGELPTVRIGGSIFVREESLREWIRGRETRQPTRARARAASHA